MHKASPTIKRCLCLLQLLPTKGVFTFITLTDGPTHFPFLISVFYKLCLDKSHTEKCPLNTWTWAAMTLLWKWNGPLGNDLNELKKKISSGNNKRNVLEARPVPTTIGNQHLKLSEQSLWFQDARPKSSALLNLGPVISRNRVWIIAQHSSPSVVLWLVKNYLKYIECF